ncbi:MAG: branched-chain amino acid transport system substrate-binding protein [Thalassolituus sp.]|jgi:branched-chain amino acid transport system substrate-binding protein
MLIFIRDMALVAAIVLLSGYSFAADLDTDRTIKIYHDADYSNHESSALAMMMGLNTALDEVGFQLQGYRLELVPKNHRGNSVRSKQHINEFIEDPDALFILGGLHSSPYIRYRDYINENQVLLLIPWAAGGPITRYDQGLNWVFRLSIDDTKAGYRMIQYAHDKKSCKTPHLLLEDTPWGKSNFETMSKAMKQYSDVKLSVSWFNWNTKVNSARILLRDIANSGSDCILFVGNSIEGVDIFEAIVSLEESQRLPVVSHWGITGGDFEKHIDAQKREKLDLSFIQTCFSFLGDKDNAIKDSIFDRAKKLYPQALESSVNVSSPAGFIHSYDLGKLFIQAVNEIKLTGDVRVDRVAIRNKLENINTPVEGLLKIYSAPFSAWSTDDQDAHEALGLDDFCMATYDKNGHVVVYPNDYIKEVD